MKRYTNMPKCHTCGQFCAPAEWKMIYSGAIPEPEGAIYRCAKCVAKHGSFHPDPRIRPEASCGRIKKNTHIKEDAE